MRTDSNDSTLNEDVKQQINNLAYNSNLLDSLSFVDSRNDRSLNRREPSSSKHPELNIFPVVNAPTMEFTTNDIRVPDPSHTEQSFCHAQSEMLEEQDRHHNDDSIEGHGKFDLANEHRKLKAAYTALQEKFVKLERTKMLDTFGTQRSRTSSTKQLNQELKQKDRRNSQLHRQLKQATEQNRQLKEDNDKKARQLASKIAELKRQHERYEQLLNRLKQQELVTESSMTLELRSKDTEIKRLKNELVLLNSSIKELSEEKSRAKEQSLRHLEDTKRLRLSNRQLMDKLKQEMTRAQSLSIHTSRVSNNTSIMDSFSPEMLSPEQTIELIYEVFKRVSWSTRMQRILYDNSEFLNLLREFVQGAARRHG